MGADDFVNPEVMGASCAPEPTKTANKFAKANPADLLRFGGLIAFIVLMGAVVGMLWPYIHSLFEAGGIELVMSEVQNAGPLGVVILLVIQFLQIVVAFIPGEVVQVAAGMLYGPWLGTLIVLAGCVLSSAFIFQLVHRLGAPFVQSMVPTNYMERFRRFEESGKLDLLVFILFLIPGLPKDVFTYLVPLTDMKMKDFLLLATLGRIPGVFVSTYAANGLAEGDFLQSGIIFLLGAAICVIGVWQHERLIHWLEKITRKGK